jgi:hypothetical protein
LAHRVLTVLSDFRVHKVTRVLLEVIRVNWVFKELEEYRVIKAHRGTSDNPVFKEPLGLEVIKEILELPRRALVLKAMLGSRALQALRRVHLEILLQYR